MKRFILFFAVGLAVFVVWPARALDPDNLTDAETSMIAGKCRDAQKSLQQLQYVDPVTRVSRGNATANIVKLMSALNSRAAFSTFNIPGLVSATNNVQSLRQQFANDYTSYEISLRDLVAMDCRAKPAQFYRSLVDVRAKRQLLASHAVAIEQQLDAFAQSLPELTTLVKGQQ